MSGSNSTSPGEFSKTYATVDADLNLCEVGKTLAGSDYARAARKLTVGTAGTIVVSYRHPVTGADIDDTIETVYAGQELTGEFTKIKDTGTTAAKITVWW